MAAKPDSNSKGSPARAASSALSVPLPAALVGLGMLAASPTAQAAVARNDFYQIPPGGQLVGVNILANDDVDCSTPNAAYLLSLSVNPPANGNAFVVESLNPVCPKIAELTYTPAPGFVGLDSFAYTLTDINGSSNAVVTISVTEPQPVPTVAPLALGGLAGLLAFFGLRRRKDRG